MTNAVRNSGVPWLGDIAAHWNIVPSKAVLRRQRMIVGPTYKKFTLLSLTLDGVVPRDISTGRGKFPASFETYQRVSPDDLVFCLFDMDETPRTVGLATDLGMITGAYDIFRSPTRATAKYLYRLFRSFDDTKSLRPLYKGLRKTIPRDAFGGMKICLPPEPEQVLINRFLDNSDLAIARALSEKKRLLTLLDEATLAARWSCLVHSEQRTATSPDVDWMGTTPSGWKVVRLKSLLREVDQRSFTGQELLLSLRMREGLVPSAEYSSKPQDPQSLIGYKRVSKGTLVVNRMRASIGLIAVAQQEGIVSPDYATFEMRNPEEVDVEFLLGLMRSPQMGAVIRSESRGMGTGSSGFLRIYTDRLGSIPIALPTTISEQRDRVKRAAGQTAALASTTQAAMNEIRLLKEYQVRLLSDVVTGRVDIRKRAEEQSEVSPAELNSAVSMVENESPDEQLVSEV